MKIQFYNPITCFHLIQTCHKNVRKCFFATIFIANKKLHADEIL